MMANCDLDIEIPAGVWPVWCNETVARVIQDNIEAVGMPARTKEEQVIACAVQTSARIELTSLRKGDAVAQS